MTSLCSRGHWGGGLSRMLALGGVVAFAAPEGVLAQSLLAAEGLGVVVESLDARSRSIGSAGVGLVGWHLLEADPAAAAGLIVPSASATFQPSTTTLTGGETAGYTRFPSAGVSYSFRGNVFSIQIGGFLDQEWQVQATRTLDLGEAVVEAEDTFSSSGSVGRVRVGWARRITQSLAAGVTVGSHIGTVDRVFTRVLDSEIVGAGVEPFQTGGRLRASGAVAAAGIAWDPSPLLRLSGSASWSDDLVLSPSESVGEGDTGRYRMPLELRLGGTFALLPQLSLHLSSSYGDWSDTGEDLSDATPRGTALSFGGGMEWGGTTLFGRPAPVRLGARQRDLPFGLDGASASETTLSGGLGWHFVDLEDQPLARFEIGVERGVRESGTLSEDFWRVAVSVRVASG